MERIHPPPPAYPITRNDNNDTHNNPTLQQARQTWKEYIHHHPQTPQGPPPLPITSKQARNNPTLLRQAQKHWGAYLKRQERPPVPTFKQETTRDLKPQNKQANQSKHEEKQVHQQDTTKSKGRNTNKKRQMFSTSSSYSPNPIPPPCYQNPTTQRIQTKLSQPKFPNGTKTKGGQGAHTLQPKNSNTSHTSNHPHQVPISLTETNHRHLLVDFADWLQNGLHTRAPLPHNLHYETTTTYPDLRPPPRHGNSSTSDLNNRFIHTHTTTDQLANTTNFSTKPPPKD
jgi:hypothetical protein